MTHQEIIGSNIKAYREHMRLTQEDVAGFLKIQREMVSYYENGAREVPMDNLKRLSELFGIELYDLMEEYAAMSTANIAFAFRAEGLNAEDLEVVSDFKKIVRNYLKISELKDKNER